MQFDLVDWFEIENWFRIIVENVHVIQTNVAILSRLLCNLHVAYPQQYLCISLITVILAGE